MGPGIKGWKQEWHHYYYSSYPLAKFVLSVCATLCSADLQVLVPKAGMLPPGDTTMTPQNL